MQVLAINDHLADIADQLDERDVKTGIYVRLELYEHFSKSIIFTNLKESYL